MGLQKVGMKNLALKNREIGGDRKIGGAKLGSDCISISRGFWGPIFHPSGISLKIPIIVIPPSCAPPRPALVREPCWILPNPRTRPLFEFGFLSREAGEVRRARTPLVRGFWCFWAQNIFPDPFQPTFYRFILYYTIIYYIIYYIIWRCLSCTCQSDS